MKVHINENGCKDPEIRLLDTRLPYYYAKVKQLFQFEPQSVGITIVQDLGEFQRLGGQSPYEAAILKDGVIYILAPQQFSKTKVGREHFYRLLYQELVHLFYCSNQVATKA